ncbi:MAG TPA: LacI family DNA-binding transcriptional regulator [Herpetosiphonaceae bacterium]
MSHTIKDVARRAGVGIATVSRVLNGSPSVRPATRERVLAAIRDLDYRPNQAARQLVTARTHAIGVLLPFLTRPFFVEVLRGIEAVIAESDYQLIIFNVETMERREHYFGAMPFLGRLDGLIVLSLPLSEHDTARLLKTKLAAVLADTSAPGFSSVTIDNPAGARLAVEHLAGLGHHRIGFIGGPLRPHLGMSVNRLRLEGYRAAMAAAGLAIDPAWEREIGDGRAGGRAAIGELLALPSPPTAVFASTDEQAFGALDELQRRGLRPGGDLSLVGFDDLELAAYVGLTTVRQPMERMGREAAELLLARLADPAAPIEQRQVPISLVARTSSAAPPAS